MMRKELLKIIPEWPDLPSNVNVLSTTRCGGVSMAPYDDGYGLHGLNLGLHVGDDADAVLTNRALVQACLLNQSNQANQTIPYLSQVHGVNVIQGYQMLDGAQADGCFTDHVFTPCAVLTADCLPVLMCDLQGQVVAALHAGWRGLAAGILQAGVEKCRGQGGGELTAWMGPAIGAKQFEVGQDVVDIFVNQYIHAHSFFVPHTNKPSYLADLYGLARMILGEMGVQRVHGGQYCTVTQSDLFYSYRRDGVTGRMANIIWKILD